MVLGVKMAEIFEKKTRKPQFEKTRKRPRESVKIKILKIGLRSDLNWPKVALEPKFHELGTFGGLGKREHTDRQDSSMIIKHDSCMYVCMLSVFRSHQKSQGHDILAPGLLWANLKHVEAPFSTF